MSPPLAKGKCPTKEGGGFCNIKMKEIVHTKKQLKDRREKLRKSLTPAEASLWKHLKARKFEGRRFTRQHSVSNYIVDFYCAKERLIIELDGEVHNNPTSEE